MTPTTRTRSNPEPRMQVRRGDIVVVLFPESSRRRAVRRPGLVVQRSGLETGQSQAVVALISTNLELAGHPSRVRIAPNTPEGAQSGLRAESVVLTDNLATVLEEQIEKVIGRLPDMSRVDRALRHTLAL